ncbi:unnamed protein product, partial [Brassica napus]
WYLFLLLHFSKLRIVIYYIYFTMNNIFFIVFHNYLFCFPSTLIIYLSNS